MISQQKIYQTGVNVGIVWKCHRQMKGFAAQQEGIYYINFTIEKLAAATKELRIILKTDHT